MSDIVRPQSPVTETIAKIQIDSDVLRVIFPERIEKFRQILKAKISNGAALLGIEKLE